MQIAAEGRDGVTVVRIAGSVDALTAAEVTRFLQSELRGGGTRFVADLHALEYISSAGLRTLLGALKEARQAGGDLRLAAAQENVQKVLKMSGFTSILKTYPDAETAVASYVAASP